MEASKGLSETRARGDGSLKQAPGWLSYVDLACAVVAGGLWYARPQLSPWPLVVALAPWGIRFVLTGRPTRRTAFVSSFWRRRRCRSRRHTTARSPGPNSG